MSGSIFAARFGVGLPAARARPYISRGLMIAFFIQVNLYRCKYRQVLRISRYQYSQTLGYLPHIRHTRPTSRLPTEYTDAFYRPRCIRKLITAVASAIDVAQLSMRRVIDSQPRPAITITHEATSFSFRPSIYVYSSPPGRGSFCHSMYISIQVASLRYGAAAFFGRALSRAFAYASRVIITPAIYYTRASARHQYAHSISFDAESLAGGRLKRA